jgi:thiol-disulfide isomerase/thioredoxin
MTLKIKIVAVLALAAFAIAATACASGSGQAKSFSLNVYHTGGAIDGPQTTLDAVLSQGKPVVLNFWGGSCPPCVEEIPLLQYGSVEYLDDVLFLGVDIGPFTNLGTHEQAISLIGQLNITYPTGNTDDGSVMRDYNITGLPVTVFITPDGTITDRWPGVLTWSQLQRRVDDLIAASAGDAG